jgi:transcriptional regulator with XRE-family HTH domain
MQGSLATKLRVLRAERGLTLRQAADRVRVRPATLSDIEHGRSQPHDVTLAKIAKAYGVPLADLLEEPEGDGPNLLGDRPKVPPLPQLSLAALSPEELETRLFGAPVVEAEELAPALTVEEAHQLVRAARGERDVLEDWVEAYAAAPGENRLQARADKARAEEGLARAQLYYRMLLDYWSKLADPRGVPFKGLQQFVSETAEAQILMQAIKRHQDERRRCAKGKAG